MPELARLLHNKTKGPQETPVFSRISDLLPPLEKNNRGEVISRRIKDSKHVDIPQLLCSRGQISRKQLAQINFNGPNKCSLVSNGVQNRLCHDMSQLHVNGKSDSEYLNGTIKKSNNISPNDFINSDNER